MQPNQPTEPTAPADIQPPQATNPVEFGAVAVDAVQRNVDAAAPQDRPLSLPDIQPVQWQAEEYHQHEKTPLWYVGFGAVVLVLILLALLLMNTWTFALLVPIMAAALLVYTHRPPAVLTYTASAQGVSINGQLHPMGEFKAFGVRDDADRHLLTLIPVKRFRPSTTIYFPIEVGEPLVDLLGAYMPMQDTPPDFFDQLIHRLRI